MVKGKKTRRVQNQSPPTEHSKQQASRKNRGRIKAGDLCEGLGSQSVVKVAPANIRGRRQPNSGHRKADSAFQLLEDAEMQLQFPADTFSAAAATPAPPLAQSKHVFTPPLLTTTNVHLPGQSRTLAIIPFNIKLGAYSLPDVASKRLEGLRFQTYNSNRVLSTTNLWEHPSKWTVITASDSDLTMPLPQPRFEKGEDLGPPKQSSQFGFISASTAAQPRPNNGKQSEDNQPILEASTTIPSTRVASAPPMANGHAALSSTGGQTARSNQNGEATQSATNGHATKSLTTLSQASDQAKDRKASIKASRFVPPPNTIASRDGRPGQTTTALSDWRRATEIKLKFRGVTAHATTSSIWHALRRHGEMSTIEFYVDRDGNRDGSGCVRFRPPPKTDFWSKGTYEAIFPPDDHATKFKLILEKIDRSDIQAPKSGRSYPEKMVLASSLNFGFMFGPTTMKSMYSVVPQPKVPIVFHQDLKYKDIEISFPVQFKQSSPGQKQEGPRTYKLRFSHTSRMVVWQPPSSPSSPHISKLVISLEAPPEYMVKDDDESSHQPGARIWNINDAWFRQTSIESKYSAPTKAPTSLKGPPRSLINLGRWTTFELSVNLSEESMNRSQYERFCDALHDFNIDIIQSPSFDFLYGNVNAVWGYVDSPAETKQARVSSLAELMDDTVIHLPFEVRYQLEVCISEGLLNEHNVPRAFIERLNGMDIVKAVELLEDVSAYGKRFHEPMDVFGPSRPRSVTKKRKVPHYCTYVRSAVITPTTIYFTTPTIEISNRIVRQFSKYGDRFLRVRFSDDKPKGKIYSSLKENMRDVFQRVKDTLTNGISIGDRHYEFLAFGNSQFRENGAYFYSPVEHLTADKMRAWMGNFSDIKSVAKYAARLGQCFSTTRAIHGAKGVLVEIPDVVDAATGQMVFTDGVGMISKAIAQIAASELKVMTPDGEPPSVVQFRLGGSKGVLAVWKDTKPGLNIYLRPSQYKFHAMYDGLEVIRWSQYSVTHLNRQLILVLSELGVPEKVFIGKMKEQLLNLGLAMRDEVAALQMLQAQVDPNQMTLTLAAMVMDGFQRVKEPFMNSLLRLWRAHSIKYLKEKAKIVVPKGAVLLGCTDEARVLKGHFNDKQPKNNPPTDQERFEATPEIFVQVSRGENGRPQVIKGYMILARNPSMHPGDIRVVRGVDRPELRHLRDVVVLPQTGDRDLANMCSGGDLDGDDYVVIWDQDLLPMVWNCEPMDYTKIAEQFVPNVTMDDITTFFVTYMKNDALGTIATAHLGMADFDPAGIESPKCLELARLHSKAVDFPKSGQSAEITRDLFPQQWPHYMERNSGKSYKSTKILGKLYDLVERIHFMPDWDSPFDKRILERYQLGEEVLQAAKDVKLRYDASVRRIMAQHEIATDFEVWSTFVMHHTKEGSDFKYHEVIGQLSTALRETFSAECYEKAGGREISNIGPFVAAMYKVTSDEVAQALDECQAGLREKTKAAMPLMSFPWLFSSVLGRIASGKLGNPKAVIPNWAAARKVSDKHREKGKGFIVVDKEQDALKTKAGVMHRGDILTLFDSKTQPQKIANTGPLIDWDDDNFTENGPTTGQVDNARSSALSDLAELVAGLNDQDLKPETTVADVTSKPSVVSEVAPPTVELPVRVNPYDNDIKVTRSQTHELAPPKPSPGVLGNSGGGVSYLARSRLASVEVDISDEVGVKDAEATESKKESVKMTEAEKEEGEDGGSESDEENVRVIPPKKSNLLERLAMLHE